MHPIMYYGITNTITVLYVQKRVVLVEYATCWYYRMCSWVHMHSGTYVSMQIGFYGICYQNMLYGW
jgi:hypothetical protein